MSRPDDPRDAKNLDEACRNDNGTYNGYRLLSWLSRATFGGRGLSEDEVREVAAEVRARRGAAQEER